MGERSTEGFHTHIISYYRATNRIVNLVNKVNIKTPKKT